MGETKNQCWFFHDWVVIEETNQHSVEQSIKREMAGPERSIGCTSRYDSPRLKLRVCNHCELVDNQIERFTEAERDRQHRDYQRKCELAKVAGVEPPVIGYGIPTVPPPPPPKPS